VDDHAGRVCQPFIDEWDDFGREDATILDLSRLAKQALPGSSAEGTTRYLVRISST
jgi:hypothetical protein